MTRQILAWRCALRIARRDVRRHLLRSLLVVLLVATPVAAGTVVEITDRTNRDPAFAVERAYGPADAGAWDDRFADRGPLDTIEAPLLPAGIRVIPTPRQFRVGFIGVDVARVPGDLLLVDDVHEPLVRNRVRLEAGRAPAAADEALVNRRLAKTLGKLDSDGKLLADATVNLAGGTSAKVVGLATNPGCLSCPFAVAPFHTSLVAERGVFRPLWAGSGVDSPQVAYAFLLDLPADADPAEVEAALERQQFGFVPRSSFARNLLWSDPDISRWDPVRDAAFTGLLAGLGLFEFVLLSGTALAIGARRQAHDLALLAAQGARRRDLRRVVLAQGLLLGLAGAATGVGVVALSTRLLHGWWERRIDAVVDNLASRPAEIAAIAAVGVAAAVAAALVPAVEAGRLRVIDASGGRLRAPAARPFRRVAGGGSLVVAGAAMGVLGCLALDRDGYSISSRLPGVKVGDNALTSLPGATAVLLVLLGAVTAVAGVVLLMPLLLDLFDRRSRRLPLSVRLAARDIAQARHRTAPAACAVAVAVAGVVAASVMVASDERADYLSAIPTLPAGTVLVTPARVDPEIPGRRLPDRDARRQVDAAAAAVASRLPDPRRILVNPVDLPRRQDFFDDPSLPFSGEVASGVPAPSDSCPDGEPSCYLPSADLTVADAELVRITADEGADLTAVAQALDAGKAIAFAPRQLDAAGRVNVILPLTEDQDRLRFEQLPAVLVTPRDLFFALPAAFVSAATARAHGWGLRAPDILITHGPASTADIRAAVAAADRYAVAVTAAALPERGDREPSTSGPVWLRGTALIALLGTAIPLALSAWEGRADAATLAAVGLGPRRRRRVAAVQSLLLAAVGTVLGLAVGLGFANAARPATGSPDTVVPWGELGLGVLAVLVLAAAAGLAGSARRPIMTRRAD